MNRTRICAAHARLRIRGVAGEVDLRQRGSPVSGQRERLGEAQPAGDEPAVHRDRAFELPHRLAESPSEDQEVPQVHREPEVERVQPDRLANEIESPVELAEHHQQVTVREMGRRVARVARERLHEGLPGRVDVPVEEEGDGA